MPSMLFNDPRHRSVTMTLPKNPREFVRGYELKSVEGPVEHVLELGLETSISAVAGIANDVRPGDFLRLYTAGSEQIGDKNVERKDSRTLHFECCQVLLANRRLSPETKLKLPVILGRGDRLVIRVDLPMYIWLFGHEVPQEEPCPHCEETGWHRNDCPTRRWPQNLDQLHRP